MQKAESKTGTSWNVDIPLIMLLMLQMDMFSQSDQCMFTLLAREDY